MTTRRSLAVTAVAPLLLLAACSSSSSGSGGSGEESKSAEQIYSDAAAAVSGASSMRVTEEGTDSSGSRHQILESTPTTARVTDTSGNGTIVVVVIGTSVYGSQDGVAFNALPPSVASTLSWLPLKKYGACVARGHGGLTKGGVTTINGRRVIEIKDDGAGAGNAPGSVLVALDGPPLPVRVTLTAPQKPGGDRSCGASDTDTTTHSQLDFDFSQAAPQITPPPGAPLPVV